MERLRTHKTALGLYALLLILPTIVLGGLNWHQIVLDHRTRLNSVPHQADDAARRLLDVVRQRLDELIQSEEARDYFVYAPIYSPQGQVGDDLPLQRSPLRSIERPEGLLAWFGYDRFAGPEAPISLFTGHAGSGPPVRNTEFTQTVRRDISRHANDGFLRWAWRLEDFQEDLRVPLSSAAVHLGQEEHIDCIEECRLGWGEATIEIVLSRFHLQIDRDADGSLRVLATRRAIYGQDPGLDELRERYPCLELLTHGFGLVQGFFIDPIWLFEELPVMAANQALAGSERFVPDSALDSAPASEHVKHVSLIEELNLEYTDLGDESPATFGVGLDTMHLEDNFRSQSLRFFSVTAMLVLSLGTGLILLLRSVARELEQVARTQNFVASVTHELRTPLAAIQLHGEMLLDGWVSDSEQRSTYYQRIVRETRRLSTLVERVLEKSRLAASKVEPVVGDLNELIRELRPVVEQRAGGEGEDLHFDLTPDLPPILLTEEAVRDTLVNLVENARKYAPVAAGQEPIEVATGMRRGQVFLEVRDRGPGVPPEAQARVFEAFFRVGDEATRTSEGTGLGLHLVQLHAETIGARISIHDRQGGGAVFRVAFRST